MKTRQRTLAVAAMFLLIVGLLAVCGVYAESMTATITSDDGNQVRLRSGPGTFYSVKYSYPSGTAVTVLQKGSNWSQVRVGSVSGYIQNRYLIFGTSNAGSVNSSARYEWYVRSDNGLRVWLRVSPNGQKIDLYSDGTPVTMLKQGSTWSYISIDGTLGYMMTQYLSKEKVPVEQYRLNNISLNIIDPQVGDILYPTFTPEDATVKYRWYVGTVLKSTDSAFTVLKDFVGETIKVVVQATGDYEGKLSFVTNEVTDHAFLESAYLNITAPCVSDLLYVNTVPGSAVVTYSWRSNGKEVSTDSSYVVQESDVGRLIQVKVTGISGNLGSVVATADKVVGESRCVESVRISKKTPVVGETLRAIPTPSDIEASYMWRVNGILVSDKDNYTVQEHDVGAQIELTATGVYPYSGVATAITERVSEARLLGATISTTAPVVGDKIEVYVLPTSASYSVEWYLDDLLISTDTRLTVLKDYVGGAVKAKVYGTGIYGGTATTATTDEVVEYPVIAAIRLNNTSPVPGNELTAKVTFYPEVTNTARRKALLSMCTFEWKVGSTTVPGEYDDSYVVTKADVGNEIQVRAVKGPDGAMSGISSTWTTAVASSKKLTSVKVTVADTGEDAKKVNPEVGQTLLAEALPLASGNNVRYRWKLGGKVIGTGNTLVLKSSYKVNGKTITTKGKTIQVEAIGKKTYTGTVKAATKAVQVKSGIDVNLSITSPKVGKLPQYSVSGKMLNEKGNVITVLTATIEWGEYDGNDFTILPLDEFGAFLPGKKYDARLTMEIKSGYSTTDCYITVNGTAVPYENIIGNTVYVTQFAATSAVTPISDLYISAIGTPVFGEKAVTEFETEQYSAVVDWTSGVDTRGRYVYTEDYECTITITPKSGYSYAELQENAFVVNQAQVSYYTAGSNEIRAKFYVEHEFKLLTDAVEVVLDGTKDRLVLCTVTMDGERQDSEDVEWSLSGDISEQGTAITSGGILTIDKNETTEKVITISAEYLIGSKTYTDSRKITISSGISEEGIDVVFQKYRRSVVRGESNVEFKAYVNNSKLGVEYILRTDNVSSSKTKLNKVTGMLTVGKDETADYLTILARSLEDPTIMASMDVKVRKEAEELISIDWSAVVDCKFTTATTEKALLAALPKEVPITTTGDPENAELSWTLNGFDPVKTEDYYFTATAEVILPTNVENPDQVSTTRDINITIVYQLKGTLNSIDWTGFSDVSYKYGTTEEAILAALPKQVEIDTTTGNIYTGVKWTLIDFDPSREDEYSFVALVEAVLPTGITNPNSVSLKKNLTITIRAKDENALVSIDWSAVTDQTYAWGISESTLMASLPTQVPMVTTSGNTTGQLSWTLSGFDPIQIEEYSFTAVGTVVLSSGISNPDKVTLSRDITITITAMSLDPLTVSISSSEGSVVETGETVILTAQVNGGLAPYTYEWLEYAETASTLSMVMPESDTTVYVKVTDANGTEKTGSVLLSVYQPMVAVIESAEGSTVVAGTTVHLTVQVTGGTGSYVYLWNNGATAADRTVTVNKTTVYDCTISDGKHSTNVSIEIAVAEP